MNKRIDAYSNQPRFRQLFRRLLKCDFPIVKLGAIATEIFSGSTPLSGGDAYTSEAEGVPFIRSGEITEEGTVTLPTEVNLKREIHEGQMRRSQLRQGDLLIAIVGATIGQVGIYASDKAANINQAIAGVRLDTSRVLPRYVCAFLKTRTGQEILDFLKRPVARANVNLEEIEEIIIPLPDIQTQRSFVIEADRAIETRNTKLAEADALLAGLDEYLLNKLAIKPALKSNRTTYAVKLKEVLSVQRLSPDYFHPQRVSAITSMSRSAAHLNVMRLDEIAEFIRHQAKRGESDRYIGLANVQSNTGELVEAPEEEGNGQCFAFRENDVLFARLRPYLNKVHRAESRGVCSTEFHVIRIRNRPARGEPVLPEYLATILRSSLIVSQTGRMMTGNTHPRLANHDVVNLMVPIPSPAVQKQIGIEIQHRRMEARRLRKEAEAEWQVAKERFEARLLGVAKEPPIAVQPKQALEIVPIEWARPFKTHLPFYSLKAAAGKLSGSQDVVEEGWVKIEDRKLEREMFVAQVIGKSMEPRIPNRSYCLFRANPVGSRQGKIVLVQYRGPADPDTGGQYTVKRYRSKKIEKPDESWKHQEIRLEPLNSSYEPIVLYPKNEGAVQVLAEFLAVLR